jgi:hypothetical protein
MRSDTCLSLDQYARLMGIDPWRMAQINLTPSGSPSTIYPVAPSGAGNDCACVAQHAWQGNYLSRDDIVQAIRRAEEIFLDWTCTYPCPTCVIGERHPVSRNAMRPPAPRYQIAPRLKEVQAFGRCVQTLRHASVTLVREQASVLQKTFTAQFSVPDNTLAEDVLVFLKPADADYVGAPLPEHQIKPVTVVIDSSGGSGNWIAQMKAPAYLFVLPSKYEDSGACLEHIAGNYVSAVSIYLQSVDACAQGTAHYPNTPRNRPPCTETTQGICLVQQGEYSWQVDFAECNEADVYQRYCRYEIPSAFEINYVAGYALERGKIAQPYADILAGLATALIECSEQSCECSTCKTSKFEYWRTVPTQKIGEGGAGSIGDQYSVLVTKEMLNALRGLPPRNGVLYAYSRLKHLRCI